MKEKAKAPEKEMGKGEARIQATGARRQGKRGGEKMRARGEQKRRERAETRKGGRDENAGIAQGGGIGYTEYNKERREKHDGVCMGGRGGCDAGQHFGQRHGADMAQYFT